MSPSAARRPRASLALRLAAVCLAGVAFIATSPPYWTDMVGYQFDPVQLNAERPFVLVRVQATVADDFGDPDIDLRLSGRALGEGCVARAHLLEGEWDGALDEAGLALVPEGAQPVGESSLVGETTELYVFLEEHPNGADALILIETDGDCDFTGVLNANASKYVKERTLDPELEAEAELLAPQATVDEAIQTRMPS